MCSISSLVPRLSPLAYIHARIYHRMTFELAGPLKIRGEFQCPAGSKVIRWNYCTRTNIRKGSEPGNEATALAQ